MPGHHVPLGPGVVLDGKYEILSRIAAGGMGEVFKARHLHLNTFRCIKVMRQALLADEVYRMRFLREARLATQIHHPNIAVVHDFFVGDGGNYMVTEFIDGTTLRQWSAAHGPFPIAVAADVATQVLSGLEHIHRRGLLHRDISPDNVMLFYDSDDRLVAKIIDLGVAKDFNTASADKTQAGVLIGNPKYMSPEQLGLIGEGEELDARADLYCLGVVLYEMIVGVPPFASETPHGYIMKHLTQSPPRFAKANPELAVPQDLESVIFRSLEKDRARRHRDARELTAALDPFLIAPAGTLTSTDVQRLRVRAERTMMHTLAVELPPTIAEPSSTEVKAHAFEVELAADVERREKAGDRDGLQRLAEAHPPGTLVGDAARAALARVSRAHSETDAFEAARKGGRSALQEFVRTHSGSAMVKDAQRLLRQIKDTEDFEAARKLGTKAAWQLYLTTHPHGAHASEARAHLESTAQPAASEAHDFDAAWETGSVAAWDSFLRKHPGSPRAAEARRCRQESADFEVAIAAGSRAMWRAFIKTWPEGRHSMDAAVRLRATK